MTEQEFETVALKNQMREVLVNEIKGLYVAEGGFDPPTSGLWAQHASSAPLCWRNSEVMLCKIFVRKKNQYFRIYALREELLTIDFWNVS